MHSHKNSTAAHPLPLGLEYKQLLLNQGWAHRLLKQKILWKTGSFQNKVLIGFWGKKSVNMKSKLFSHNDCHKYESLADES